MAELDAQTPSVEDLLTETAPEPATEQAAEQPKADEQPRDETGKFAPKDAAKEAPKVETAPEPAKAEPGKETDDGAAAHVPSWRLREVAEEKRAAEARANALEAQIAQMNARLAALDKPKEQPKQEEIDPLIDPQGFAKRLQDGFAQQLSEIQLNNNLAIAHVRHGEKFEKAFSALIETTRSGNTQIRDQLVRQPNPGEAIVRWFNDQETLREVGGDPASYKQKLLDDALKNPEFLAKAIEAAKASAAQPGRPNNITQLPPSLSRVAGSASNSDLGNELPSVEALLGR